MGDSLARVSGDGADYAGRVVNGPQSTARLDDRVRLGAQGALLTATVLFVQLPIVIWAGNASEFHSSPWQLLALGLAAVVVAVLAAAGVLHALGPRLRWVLACASCAIGLAVWVHGNFFVGTMNLLNGQGPPVDFDAGHPVMRLIAAATITTLVGFVVAKAPRVASLVMTILLVGLYVSTAAAIMREPRRTTLSDQADAPGVLRVSTRENVLVVLLDGLEWSVARDAFQYSPDIAHAFDGFHAYPDTAGVAPSTFLSLPAIHSGTVYAPPAPVSQYFVEAIGRQSFMNRFADAGFDTVLLNPTEGICPSRVRACLDGALLLRSSAAHLKQEGLQLLDLALFRASPAWLQRRIFNDGQWLTAGRMDVPTEIARVLEGNHLLDHIARELRVDDGPPTVKFVHSLSTHAPYVLNQDCRTYARNSLSLLVPQARCGLLAVAGLLDRLKEVGVYDNTVIVVMADHGFDPGRAGDDLARIWRSLASAANPAFLMKPRGSRGPLTQVSDAIYLPDLGALLCAESPRCRARAPMPLPAVSPRRSRVFNDYEWRHEFWRLRTVGGVVRYEIRGPVWKQSSWIRVSPAGP